MVSQLILARECFTTPADMAGKRLRSNMYRLDMPHQINFSPEEVG
jgi:hypothetical protein